jgi:two-component system cell cycle response regulator
MLVHRSVKLGAKYVHIALVEPSSATRIILARLLKGRGHQVGLFTNTDDALASIRGDSRINGLITSAECTPLSGIELCWEARLLAARERPLYILLTTSHTDRQIAIEALDCGADDVIVKPPAPDDLYAKLRVGERIVTLQLELIELATTDPLTALYNRRAFFIEAKKTLDDTRRAGALSAILFDVDQFKGINDHYGHDIGDRLLRALAKEARRDVGVVARLGGDEFVILLKGMDSAAAMRCAEDLRKRIENLRVETGIKRSVGFTCSLGVSELQIGDTIDDLLKRADLALYQAKVEGRNRVATPPAEEWIKQRPRQAVSLIRSLARASDHDPGIQDRRQRQTPSDVLLARVCAVIDLLIASGLSQETAAELMTEKMIMAGIPAPTAPGVTFCQRLLSWRNDLESNRTSPESRGEYEYFTAEIHGVPAQERIEKVLGESLWNRRQSCSQATAPVSTNEAN